MMISTNKKYLPVIPFSSAIFLTFLSSKKSIKYLFTFPMEKEEKKKVTKQEKIAICD